MFMKKPGHARFFHIWRLLDAYLGNVHEMNSQRMAQNFVDGQLVARGA